jgi:hypothetical protein
MSAAGRIMQLARLAQQVNALIDCGDYDRITPQDVRAPAFIDELFRIIRTAGGRSIDTTVHIGGSLGPSEEFVEWFRREVAALDADLTGKEWQLRHVEKRGLCLVQVWITEIIGAEAETLA